MAHMFDSGYAVREPAWHGLATVVQEYPGSWDEARKLAGLDWEPVLKPAYIQSGWDELGPDLVVPSYVQTPFKVVVRDDNGKAIATVGEGFGLVRNGDMGPIVEAILDQPNVKYETAGSLRGGRSVWVLARLDEPYVIPGDTSETYPYVTLLNSHDGTGACKVLATDIRVVCWNTFSAANAHGERTGREFSFRHTGTVMSRIEEAREAITGVRRESERFRKLCEGLVKIHINGRQRELFLAEFVPTEPVMSDRRVTHVNTVREQIRSILDGPTCAGVADTAYGLVQASVEYLDHVRRARTRETHFGRTIRPEPLKAKAVALATSIGTGS